MINKIKDLLGSIRFWIVTFGWLSDYLGKIQADGFDWVVMFNQIGWWLGTVAAIGTADALVNKFKK